MDLSITFDDVMVNCDLTDFGGKMSSIVADPTAPGNLVAKVVKDLMQNGGAIRIILKRFTFIYGAA